MGVVGGNQEASRNSLQVFLLVFPQGEADPLQHIRQKRGVSTLLGKASHFLVVKNAADGHTAGISLTAKKALHDGEGALQVIQPGGGQVLLIGAPDGAGSAAVQEQIRSQDIFRLNTQLIGNEPGKLPLGPLVSQKRDQIFLGMILVAAVYLGIHMDGQTGHHQQVPVDIDQAGFQSVPGFYHGPAGHGQGTVKPGSADHASVPFHVQFHIAAFRFKILFFLDLEAGGIAVGGADLKV